MGLEFGIGKGNTKPLYFKRVLYISMVVCLFLSCKEQRVLDYQEQLHIRKGQYNKIVLLLDFGCDPCKDRFFKYVQDDWPDSTALIIRRGITRETQLQNSEILVRDFLYMDSLDKSFESGLTGKNTEMALIRDGKVFHYNFLQYEELIKELENK